MTTPLMSTPNTAKELGTRGEPHEYVHPPDEIKLIEVSHHSLEKDKKKLKILVEDLSQVSDHLIRVGELSDNIKEIEEEIRKELLV